MVPCRGAGTGSVLGGPASGGADCAVLCVAAPSRKKFSADSGSRLSSAPPAPALGAGSVAGRGRLHGSERRDVVVQPARVDPAGEEVVVAQHVAQEARVRVQAADLELGQRTGETLRRHREPTRRRMRDDLAQQRVEVGVGAVAGVAEGVDADAGARGEVEVREFAAGGTHGAVGLHLLGVDAGLDGVALRRRDRRLLQADAGQVVATGDPELGPHQVDAGDGLGDGVLDLQAGVGLDEEEAVVVGRVLQELERAQAGVGDGRRHAHGGAGDRLALRRSQGGAGRQLDQLLVATLHAALALAEVADRARAVADHLHLDVPGARDELLDVDGAGAEGRVGLGLTARVRLVQLVDRRDHAHAPAAAAGERLDHDLRALAQALEEGPRLGGADGAGGAGQDGDTVLGRQGAGAGLVAQQLQRPHGRPDERNAGLTAAAREGGALGQEAVARMDGVAARRRRDGEHALDVEVGGGAQTGQGTGFIGGAHVQRVGVVLGEDGHRRDAEFLGRAHDADRDFAAVGDQEFAERHDTDPSQPLLRERPGLSPARRTSEKRA